MSKKKVCYGFLLGMLMLMLCPILISAATNDPPVKTYSSGTWKLKNRVKYYYDSSGKKVTGWAKIGENTYYFQKDGSMKTGWLNYKDQDYYFTTKSRSGAMVTGFYVTSAGSRYYFNSKGAAQSGTFSVKTNKGTNTYYANRTSHRLLTNQWRQISGTWYYFDSTGARHTRWFDISSRRYFCHPNKGKLTGWKKLYSKWYYFTSGGYLAKSQWMEHGSQMWYLNDQGEVEKKVSKASGTSRDYDSVIMVGDSRFYHTYIDYGISADNTYFVVRQGRGYNWLVNTAYSKILTEAQRNYEYNQQYGGTGRTAIVLNLGVNDLTNINKYLNFVNTKLVDLAVQYDCDLYYVSINPVAESKFGSGGKNDNTKKMSAILTFNKKLKNGLDYSVEYIDTCTYLTNKYSYEEITVSDGVHYTSQASRVIFDRIMLTIRPKNN